MPLAAAAGFLGATAVVAGVAQGTAPKWHDELPNWIVVFLAVTAVWLLSRRFFPVLTQAVPTFQNGTQLQMRKGLVLLHILLGLAIAGALLVPQACNDKLGNSAWWTHRKLLAVLVALFLLDMIPFTVRLYANKLPDSDNAGLRRVDTLIKHVVIPGGFVIIILPLLPFVKQCKLWLSVVWLLSVWPFVFMMNGP